jgi:hypothetical protein
MKFPLIAASFVLLLGCAHRTGAARDAAPSHDPDLLTAEEFAGVRGATVYDAVQQLRPAWLMHSRPSTAIQGAQDVVIYVDGVRYGAGMDGLRTLPLRSVASLRYYSPGNATARFGQGNVLGAIEVITVPR